MNNEVVFEFVQMGKFLENNNIQWVHVFPWSTKYGSNIGERFRNSSHQILEKVTLKVLVASLL